jgi:hypothetical protein
LKGKFTRDFKLSGRSWRNSRRERTRSKISSLKASQLRKAGLALAQSRSKRAANKSRSHPKGVKAKSIKSPSIRNDLYHYNKFILKFYTGKLIYSS